MKASQMLKAMAKAGKRAHLVGNEDAGVIVALDMEGRLFAVLKGEILNRVNPEAVAGHSTRQRYLNPGGDGLWPAPEGTTVGYQYAAGAWRTPPGLCAARYLVVETGARRALVCAEVDLVNNRGIGVPTIFKREVSLASRRGSLSVRVRESITYIGREPLQRSDCRLAPWTLCQFDSGPGCEVAFPCTQQASVWDLYDDPSDRQRSWSGRMCRTQTDGSQRYQIAIDEQTAWIEFRDPKLGLRVRRKANSPPVGQSYIDIRDAATDVSPGDKGVRYSVYSDATRFMEIEAIGGCPEIIRPNDEMSVVVSTEFKRN